KSPSLTRSQEPGGGTRPRSGWVIGSGATLLLGYGALIAGSVLLYLLLRSFGERMDAPAAPAVSLLPGAHSAASEDTLLRVLVSRLVMMGGSRLVGAIFRSLHQPSVIGEMLAGILLGPSLLGIVAPAVSAAVFPASVMPLLGILAQLGVLLFMFVVGLELN